MIAQHDPAEIRARIAGRRVVASISGGKDSAAMSLYLRELGIEHDRVFADTGWEHPKTYEYLRGELARVLGPIHEVRSERGSFVDVVRAHGMFPSRKRRFCTVELKIEPLSAFVRSMDVEVVNAVGIRAEESEERAKFPEWEWSETFDCEVWRPVLAWTEQEVIAIHKRHGLPPNPLYLMGASRVGCWPCINSRKEEIRLVALTDAGRIAEIDALEREVTAGAALRAEAKGVDPSQRAMFQARMEEPGNKWPAWPIRKVVAWSRTSRGGRHLELFHEPSDGCARWGMCETAPTNKEGT